MKTALIGNGLSIAYNPQLSCQALQAHLTSQLATLGTGTDVESTLANLACSLDPTADDGLESLLGPLDLLGGAIGHLGALAPLTALAPAQIVNAAGDVEKFARAVYRTGTSHVLEAIADGSQGGAHSVIGQFAAQIAGCSGPVTVATLNYDGLLHSGVLDTVPITDLAAGYDEGDFTVVSGAAQMWGRRLRHRDDLTTGMELVNLHGSLGWLERDQEFVKFNISALRSQDYWANWRQGRSQWMPVVALTNQQAKSRRVLQYPFHLAYSIFEDRLCRSSHWLIAGYSLGDGPVNAALARAAKVSGSRLDKCLVVTIDPTLTPTKVEALAKIPASRIDICADGFPNVFDSTEWQAWKAA